MISFDTLLAEIGLYVAGCPDITVTTEIRNAVIALCADGLAWQIDGDVETHPADEPLYDLPLPSLSKLAEVIDVYIDGVLVNPTPPDQLYLKFQNWHTATNAPMTYFVDASSLRLVPTPNKDVTIQTRIAVKPSRTATGVEDFLYEKYWEEIIKPGALYRLQIIPRQPWSDPVQAVYHRDQARIGVDQLKIATLRGNTRRSVNAIPRRFGG